MITTICIYKKDTGEIVSAGGITFIGEFKEQQVQAALAPWGIETHALFEAGSELGSETDPAAHYVGRVGDSTQRLDRPPVPYVVDKTTLVAGTGDFVTITGLHNPCTIVVDDPDPTVETAVHEVTDGGFEFEPLTPGLYVIEISRFPFIPARIEITAT